MVDGTKGGNLARSAEHLVDFACVKLLGIDHLPGILLDNDRVSFSAFEQFAVKGERFRFALQRLPHNCVDVVVIAVKQGADCQRWIFTEHGDHFPCLLGMGQQLGCLFAHPRHDRNSIVSEHKERIMSVSDHSLWEALKHPRVLMLSLIYFGTAAAGYG